MSGDTSSQPLHGPGPTSPLPFLLVLLTPACTPPWLRRLHPLLHSYFLFSVPSCTFYLRAESPYGTPKYVYMYRVK